MTKSFRFTNHSTIQSIEVISPQEMTKTDITSPQFAHAIYEASEHLPDVPYDFAQYEPVNAVETPDEYPQSPNPRLLQPEFFARFDLSTLFYIFFYFPGTPQQYFAGRELKQREWRFHTKYQTWFHRIGSPTEITQNYEIGTFMYFDHNTSEGWCVRQRDSFKFEYECLQIS